VKSDSGIDVVMTEYEFVKVKDVVSELDSVLELEDDVD
jgi:hypothetical protein